MDEVGAQLPAQAVEFGMSDAEVARRAGLMATRYGSYASDCQDPDPATLVSVCQVLGFRPDDLLAFVATQADALGTRRRRAAGL